MLSQGQICFAGLATVGIGLPAGTRNRKKNIFLYFKVKGGRGGYECLTSKTRDYHIFIF